MDPLDALNEIAKVGGGKINEVGILPGGSGFATMSFPLKDTHWIYGKELGDEFEAPPMPFKMGTEDRIFVSVKSAIPQPRPTIAELEKILAEEPSGVIEITPDGQVQVGGGYSRQAFADEIRQAARYAIRAATMKGKEMDFDPDALVQNLVVGLLGFWTKNGLTNTEDDWANPPRFRQGASE